MTVKPASLFTNPYFHSHFGSDKVIMAVAMTSIHMYIYIHQYLVMIWLTEHST